MFTLIKDFTELDDSLDEDISDHLANPVSKQCKYAYFINLEEKSSEIIYKGIADIPEEVGDKEKVIKYLYPKNRTPNGPNKTPTVIFNDFEKSYQKKIFNWFLNNQGENILFKKIYECLENNSELVEKDFSNKINNLKQNFLSIKINGKYIGEREEFTGLFNDEQFKQTISGNKWNLKDSICLVCSEKREILYGNAIPYVFNFASPASNFCYEFQEKSVVKQMPVCFDCAKKIAGSGTKYLEENLKFTLAGNNYFLIPELLCKTEENREKFKQIIARLKQSRSELFSLDKKNDRDQLISKEKAILRKLENENYLMLNMFFYNINNQEFQILANIEEILPSNLRKFFDTVDKYEDLFNKTNIFIPKKDENASITFDFNLLYHLLENDKTDYSKRSKKEFFETLDKILNLKKLSYQYFLDKVIKKIHENAADFLQDKLSWVKQISFNSFLLINILADLELISIGEIKEMSTPILDQFCNEYSKFFNSPAKKAIFGLGALTEKLANIQYVERTSKPIYKKLRNFKLDQKYLTEKLIPELKDKFIAYDCHYKHIGDLFEEISSCLLADTAILTSSEASYIFVLGMNLQKQLLPAKDKANETDNSNKEMKNDN